MSLGGHVKPSSSIAGMSVQRKPGYWRRESSMAGPLKCNPVADCHANVNSIQGAAAAGVWFGE
eukprot:5182858-Pyramimonas_sp.AAC.1